MKTFDWGKVSSLIQAIENEGNQSLYEFFHNVLNDMDEASRTDEFLPFGDAFLARLEKDCKFEYTDPCNDTVVYRGICEACKDNGFIVTSDPENGPEFDRIDYCDCDAGVIAITRDHGEEPKS